MNHSHSHEDYTKLNKDMGDLTVTIQPAMTYEQALKLNNQNYDRKLRQVKGV